MSLLCWPSQSTWQNRNCNSSRSKSWRSSATWLVIKFYCYLNDETQGWPSLRQPSPPAQTPHKPHKQTVFPALLPICSACLARIKPGQDRQSHFVYSFSPIHIYLLRLVSVNGDTCCILNGRQPAHWGCFLVAGLGMWQVTGQSGRGQNAEGAWQHIPRNRLRLSPSLAFWSANVPTRFAAIILRSFVH